MIRCPSCGGKSGVTDSRPRGDTIQRRRKCKSCGVSWMTTEQVVFNAPDMVLRQHLSLSEIARLTGKTERAVAIELSRRGVRPGLSVPNRRRPYAVPKELEPEYRRLIKKGFRVQEIGVILGLLPRQ